MLGRPHDPPRGNDTPLFVGQLRFSPGTPQQSGWITGKERRRLPAWFASRPPPETGSPCSADCCSWRGQRDSRGLRREGRRRPLVWDADAAGFFDRRPRPIPETIGANTKPFVAASLPFAVPVHPFGTPRCRAKSLAA